MAFCKIPYTGVVKKPLILSQVSDEKLIKMYKKMVTLNVMDKILYDAQRQVNKLLIIGCYGADRDVFHST